MEVVPISNAPVLVVSQEVSLKEAMLEKLETAMETYRRKFAIARHQMGLLYLDHNHEKQVSLLRVYVIFISEQFTF